MAFAPSALAIHPLTGHLYLLSSVGKLLVVLDRETGAIIYVQKLKKSVHPQPEGICFDPDGTMYISNEGKDGNGLIHKFAYLPKK
ncbi:MAG: SdiA-regulated domain-containing protein [Saprospirales bacterium]|nr:SdiA-regulated domain-containing protein [Saprospirales bacterium]